MVKSGPSDKKLQKDARHYRRYQLQWRPTFTRAINNDKRTEHRSYTLGEKMRRLGPGYDNITEHLEFDNKISYDEILRVAYNSTLILPFNTGVALAQEYSPSVKNKLVVYNTLGGNSVTTFGQATKRIGLQIRIIKAGKNWEVYYKGLEALAYLSANQGRYFGNLFLIGYDVFDDRSQALTGRYKVVVDSLEFSQRSDTNTTLAANLQMIVTHDYTAGLGGKTQVWGSL